jgi:hypothetical protein
VRDAAHAEYGEAGTQVITLLACSLMDQHIQIAIVPGSRLAALYGGASGADERTTCNYGLAPELLARADQRSARPHSIKSIALVDSTPEYVRLSILELLPRFDPEPDEWALARGIADLLEDGEPTALAVGTPEDAVFLVPACSVCSRLRVWAAQAARGPAGVVALEVLKRVYRQFGLPESAIRLFETER